MMKSHWINAIFVLLFLALVAFDRIMALHVWWPYVVMAVAYIMFQIYGSMNVSSQFFLPVRTKAEPSRPCVAITFDDGPIRGKTERVLDILKETGVAATFFCIGCNVKENPELTIRIQQEGHLLGNHSFWHGKLFDLQTTRQIARELKATDAVIQQYTGVKPMFFRPPYGVTNPMVASAVKQNGYIAVGWSIRSFDTVIKDHSRLLDRVMRSIKGGDIILFHDYSESMIRILPALFVGIQNLGLKIVRLDELLNEKPYAH